MPLARSIRTSPFRPAALPHRRQRMPRLLALTAALLPAPALAANNDPVHTEETPTSITLTNGLLTFTIDKARGNVNSMKTLLHGQWTELTDARQGIYMHYVDADPDGKALHPNPVQKSMTRLVSTSDDAADAVIGTMPTKDIPFHIEWHLLLRRGEPGIYSWLTYQHGPGMGPATFAQGGFVLRGGTGQSLFTHYAVDDKRIGPYPTGKVVKTLQDTTWLYDNGFIQQKYDFCATEETDNVFGMGGNHGVGLWMIVPSREYFNGGPLRQELTVHEGPVDNGPYGNINQWIFQGGHFGGKATVVQQDETWSKFYGPMYIYINQAPTMDALWADAKKRAAAEEAKWPYTFIKNPDYPLLRGKVEGAIHVTDGASPKNAIVVLAEPDAPDWCLDAKGYEFWARADDAGHFLIPKVRPGRYRLFITGANQFEDYQQDNITVTAGQTNTLPAISWKPITHGVTLWQIGTPDRLSAEFKGGDDVRHYWTYTRYLKDFPEDVTFTIGKSHANTDWNYAQWAWYAKKPYWSILFDQPAAPKGVATLTIALAAADAPKLDLFLNATPLKTLTLAVSGQAIYRSGGHDQLRQTFTIPFDASLIHQGQNELRLALPGAVPAAQHADLASNAVRGVIYDALRLEIDPAAKP